MIDHAEECNCMECRFGIVQSTPPIGPDNTDALTKAPLSPDIPDLRRCQHFWRTVESNGTWVTRCELCGEPKPLDLTLPELLESTKDHVMTDEEKEAQRQSWVRGEMGLDEGVTRISRGGAQPEPDLGKLELRHGAIWTCVRSVDHGLVWRPVLTAQELRDAIARAVSSPAPQIGFVTDQTHSGPSCTLCGAQFKCPSCGSSPAPSPARCQNCDHEVSLHQPRGYGGCTKRIAVRDGDDYCPCVKSDVEAGVTGNEGKELKGEEITKAAFDALTPERTEEILQEVEERFGPAPLASPAVVTLREQAFHTAWGGPFGYGLVVKLEDVEAKVSGLEAQLQQAHEQEKELRRSLQEEYARVSIRNEHILQLQRTVKEQRVEALERMRAGGKS